MTMFMRAEQHGGCGGGYREWMERWRGGRWEVGYGLLGTVRRSSMKAEQGVFGVQSGGGGWRAAWCLGSGVDGG